MCFIDVFLPITERNKSYECIKRMERLHQHDFLGRNEFSGSYDFTVSLGELFKFTSLSVDSDTEVYELIVGLEKYNLVNTLSAIKHNISNEYEVCLGKQWAC
jgi:hypothetical protein